MKKKTSILVIGFLCILLCACSGNEKKVEEPTISVAYGTYAIDVESYPDLAGDADYVIVGKVVEELGTEYQDKAEIETENGENQIVGTPYTNYSVEVEENLKGQLNQKAPIVILKEGGISEDGTNLASGMNSTIPLDDSALNGISTMKLSDKSEKDLLMEIRDAVTNQIIHERDRAVSADDVGVQ